MIRKLSFPMRTSTSGCRAKKPYVLQPVCLERGMYEEE